MDIFSEFATDPVKEQEGVWHPIGEDASLLIARAGNRKYSRILAREVEKSQRVLDLKNDASDDLSDSIMIDANAQAILLGWKGLSFKGEKIADGYDLETAKKLLAVKDFRALVTKLSNDFASYKAAKEAEVGKS